MKKTTQQALIILILFISGLLGLIVSFYFHQQPEPQADFPVIQTFHAPVTFVKQLAGDRDAGRKIFNEFCSACHAKNPVIDIKAPRVGDRKGWKAPSQLGISTLLKITISGAGAMPARGGCFECSDEQLRETIQYMLDKSR
jgi:cytochrome c5